MSRIALDASAVLAFLLGEPGGDVVSGHLGDALLSTVNLSEVLSKLIDGGDSDETARLRCGALSVRVVDFDEPSSQSAASLRAATRRFGLSLGDRACLALARREGAAAMTADRAWKELDLGVESMLIR